MWGTIHNVRLVLNKVKRTKILHKKIEHADRDLIIILIIDVILLTVAK